MVLQTCLLSCSKFFQKPKDMDGARMVAAGVVGSKCRFFGAGEGVQSHARELALG